ncbi:MAG: DUF3109 family protein [Bacteroidota bacterium]
MIAIDDNLISDNIYKVQFCCDLKRCFGACCVEGDAGAPLEPEEIQVLKDIFPFVKPYMQQNGVDMVEHMGVHDFDPAGKLVTPLLDSGECVFVYYEGEVAKCAIEKAHAEGVIQFKKPISCHLYPVRLRKYAYSEAVNFHEWHVCYPAIIKGKLEGIPLYVFLKEPLIRKYGQEWYEKLLLEVENRK